MKIKVKVTIPERTEIRVTSVECDFCREKITKEDLDVYCYKDVTIKYVEGFSYPEGGQETEYTFDCCYNCWEKKVLPALVTLSGRLPHTEERDFG